MTKIQEIQAKIKYLQGQLEEERSKCEHTRVIFEKGGNTGNYDPSDDCYWNSVKCIDCGQTFWFDSEEDHENYNLQSIIGSELKMKKEEYETFLKIQEQREGL